MDLGVGMARPLAGMAWDLPNAIALGGSMVVVALRIATRMDEAALAFVDWLGRNNRVFGGFCLGPDPKSPRGRGRSRSSPFAAAVSSFRPQEFAESFQSKPAHRR